MVLRITLDTDDDENEGEAEDGERPPIRAVLTLENRGGALVRLTLVCFYLSALAAVATVAVVLVGVPFVPQSAAESAALGAVLFFLTATSLSLFGYTLWSFREGRRLEAEAKEPGTGEPGPLKRVVRALRIAGTDSEELDEHERRVQKTVMGFVLACTVGAFPGRVLLALFGV